MGDPQDAGVDPALQRGSQTWATFVRSQAKAILAADFLETVMLTGTRMYVRTVIDHATRRVRVRVLGAAAQPTAAWVTVGLHHAGLRQVLEPSQDPVRSEASREHGWRRASRR